MKIGPLGQAELPDIEPSHLLPPNPPVVTCNTMLPSSSDASDRGTGTSRQFFKIQNKANLATVSGSVSLVPIAAQK